MNQSLTISLQNPSASAPRGSLLLEQKEWAPLTGYVSKAAMAGFLGSMLYGPDTENEWHAPVGCGMNDARELETVIYAYPWPASLPYRIACTHGELGEGVQAVVRQVEVLQFNLELEAATRYPCTSIISAVPLGDLLDQGGAIVPIPSIATAIDKVVLSRRVYGSIKVIYETTRHAYAMTVPLRDPAVTAENYYSSIVYAWYRGGGKFLEVQPPDGAEEYAAEGSGCGWGSMVGGDDDDDDDDGVPTSAGADRDIVYDYCSGELISDNTYGNSEY